MIEPLLEPIHPSHAASMFRILRDPAIYEFLDEAPPRSETALRARYRRLARGRPDEGPDIWLNRVVFEMPGRRCAGYVQATVHPDRTASIVYVIAPGFQRRGLATRACLQLIELLQESYGVLELFATVAPGNEPSLRLLGRLGFRELPQPSYTSVTPAAADLVFRRALAGHGESGTGERMIEIPLDAEWLETDGRGGFASGTAGLRRRRRYHALLVAASTPPTGRFALVQGCDVILETSAGRFALSSQAYEGNVLHPDGASRVSGFHSEPWPRWIFTLEDGTRISHELFVAHDRPLTALRWRLEQPAPGDAGPRRLVVRPFLSGRDIHALHFENAAFRFEPQVRGPRVTFTPYDGVPSVCLLHNGRFAPLREWYRRFIYEEEQARGFDAFEDLASPAELTFDLRSGDAVLLLAAGSDPLGESASARDLFERLHAAESTRRAAFPSALHRAGDAYLARRGNGRTIVAGYPWFTDWGRDTFVALRGLLLATGRLDEARDALVPWTTSVSGGMLPNFFPELGREPAYNSADASLWFVIAAGEWVRTMRASRRRVRSSDREALAAAVAEILDRYERGTRYGIRAAEDGLLAAGEPGVQLTWMDARVDGRIVTPRAGKPVELQALWVNALDAGAAFARENGEHAAAARLIGLRDRALSAFRTRFWNGDRGILYDVVDVDHVPGACDASFRPNQVLAVGGLPVALLEGTGAWSVVEAIEQHLLTPYGLRSLAPGESGYRPRYAGGPAERDAAYHQGTVWPWLLGPFVDAWVRVNGADAAARTRARERFLPPLRARLNSAGIGHVSEVADAEPPHKPGGCPFQAWSVGEMLRIELAILGEPAAAPPTPARVRAARP